MSICVCRRYRYWSASYMKPDLTNGFQKCVLNNNTDQFVDPTNYLRARITPCSKTCSTPLFTSYFWIQSEQKKWKDTTFLVVSSTMNMAFFCTRPVNSDYCVGKEIQACNSVEYPDQDEQTLKHCINLFTFLSSLDR